MTHGTHDGYNNLGCRCDRCRAAFSAYMRERYTVPCRRCGKDTWMLGRRGRAALEERGGLCGSCYAETCRIDHHGTESLYSKGCRCEECRAAAAANRRLRRHEGRVFTHNRAGYCNGCRCDVCREAQRVYTAERRARMSCRVTTPATTPCERRAAVLALRASGHTFQQIADKLGISRQRAHQLYTAETRKAGR